MARPSIRNAVIVLGIAGLFASSIAEAQWVMLARRAVGRVEQMSQTAPNGASYDTAAVIIDVPADRVYATVKRMVLAAQGTQGITVTRQDDAKMSLEFSKGPAIAGIQVNSLGDGLAHMMISSAHPSTPNSPTTQIVGRVFVVCKELNVECTHASAPQ
jgi:hypothetical protein